MSAEVHDPHRAPFISLRVLVVRSPRLDVPPRGPRVPPESPSAWSLPWGRLHLNGCSGDPLREVGRLLYGPRGRGRCRREGQALPNQSGYRPPRVAHRTPRTVPHSRVPETVTQTSSLDANTVSIHCDTLLYSDENTVTEEVARCRRLPPRHNPCPAVEVWDGRVVVVNDTSSLLSR